MKKLSHPNNKSDNTLAPELEANASSISTDKFKIICMILVFAFGIYQSILSWDHQAVPNSDFPAFVKLGHELLSFNAPSSYKRAPLLGVLQVATGKIVGGTTPDLNGGLVLNAVVYPFTLLLFYLICCLINQKYALWLTIIAGLNPWTLTMVPNPIAETVLLFFIMLSLYLLFKRSRWVYLAAALATMVRYDTATLILAALLFDLLEAKDKKQRLKALGFTALAVLPLIIWLTATFIDSRKMGQNHYLKEGGQKGFIIWDYLKLTWTVTFAPLLSSLPEKGKYPMPFSPALSGPITALVLAFTIIYSIIKRNWQIIAVLIFCIPFLLIHAWHGWIFHRFCSTIAWLTLLLFAFGCEHIYKLAKPKSIPEIIPAIIKVILTVTLAIWSVLLIKDAGKFSHLSPGFISLPYAAIALAIIFTGMTIYKYKKHHLLNALLAIAITATSAASGQYTVNQALGTGKTDQEFKLLTNWYLQNANPDDKMALTLPHITRLFMTEGMSNIISTKSIPGDTPQDYAKGCYTKNITYIAWDSRMGYCPSSRYYKSWKMGLFTFLHDGKDHGPYQFITRFQNQAYPKRFINLYKLKPLPQNTSK